MELVVTKTSAARVVGMIRMELLIKMVAVKANGGYLYPYSDYNP